jgi:hypothetical protein
VRWTDCPNSKVAYSRRHSGTLIKRRDEVREVPIETETAALSTHILYVGSIGQMGQSPAPKNVPL